MKILDCTLRDGGYYNDWDFSQEFIDNYFNAIAVSSVDIVEIGFRSNINNKFSGPFLFTKDSYLDNIKLPSGISYAVMVNAKELISTKSSELFKRDSSKSKIDIVRIACYPDEIFQVRNHVHSILELGYEVHLNLMQISEISEHYLVKIMQEVCSLTVSVFYLADSIGSLDQRKLQNLIGTIRKEYDGNIGLHAHDNKGQALSNSLFAIEHGVEYVDATFLGMGRGAGNTKLELLLANELTSRDVDMLTIYKFIDQYMMPLLHEYNWGSNMFYYQAALNSIHPTFIQVLLQDSRYSYEDMVSILSSLSLEDSRNFEHGRMKGVNKAIYQNTSNSFVPKIEINGKDVIIIGTGDSIDRYSGVINSYIKSSDSYILALNAKQNVNEKYVDARVACHAIRVMADLDKYRIISPAKIITPVSYLNNDQFDKLSVLNTYDYGMEIGEGLFEAGNEQCIIPERLVAAYALAIAAAGGVKNIFLIGFDGYEDQKKNNQMNEIFSIFLGYFDISITSLIPTKYNISTKSIYNFIE
jgi:4-hydroxy 2-oxovalerate aldolase